MEFFSEKEFKGKLGNIEDKKFMYVYSFFNFFILKSENFPSVFLLFLL